jgi:protease PrsW
MLLATGLLYLALAGCSILAIALVWGYDLHRREPLALMLACVLAGAVVMYGVMHGQNWWVERHFEVWDGAPAWWYAVLAGATEELGKWLVVVAFAITCRSFDDPLDGLVYGSLAGLGAAIAESVSVLGLPRHLVVLPAQEPIRLAGHLVMGGIGGYALGIRPTASWRFAWRLPACLIGAMALHTIWDIVAYKSADAARDGGKSMYGHTAAGISVMLSGLVVYRLMVVVGQRHTIRQEAMRRSSAT